MKNNMNTMDEIGSREERRGEERREVIVL